MGTTMTVSELVQQIRDGAYVLPEFQRGYVWTRETARLYLESLYRGFPTGSFLVWQTPNPAKLRGVGSQGPVFNLILDGQQRLTTIYALMTGEAPSFYEGEHLFFNIHFNVADEVFSYYKPSTMKGSPQWVPVTEFLKLGIGTWLSSEGPLPDEHRDYQFKNTTQRLDAKNQADYILSHFVAGR